MGLRSDIAKDQGVTTLVQGGDADVERKAEVKRSDSVGGLTGGWGNESESKLTDGSSEDDWRSGIRKTTVSTRNVG